jgi:hypothetical protein
MPTPPTPPLAVALIVVLEVLSAFVTIFLVYAAFLTISGERRNSAFRDLRKKVTHGCVFLIAVALSLIAIHIAAASCGLVTAAGTLFLTFLICAVLYFAKVREHWKGDHIQYTVMLWAIYWIVTGLLLLFVSWVVEQGVTFALAAVDSQSFAQYVATFAQVAGIIIAATMVVITNRHNAKKADNTSRQRIYQTLELESVKLFRFECDHRDLVALLWFSDGKNLAEVKAIADGKPLSDAERTRGLNPTEIFRLKEYMFQILNLFEMACRFCKQDIVDADIFGSWVIWMWHLSRLPTFELLWPGKDGMEFNYVADLRDIMNAGIYFSGKEPSAWGEKEREPGALEKVRLRSFYYFVAHRMFDADEQRQRDLVRGWLEPPLEGKPKYEEYWVTGENPSPAKGSRLQV